MFYHPNDTKFTAIIKHAAFWGSFVVMALMFIFFAGDEVKIPQKQVSIKIDVRSRVNICVPEENDKMFKKSLFGF